MSPPLQSSELDDIRRAFNYYQHETKAESLKIEDFRWLIHFVGALLKYVDHQKTVISDQTETLSELGISMDTLKKEVSAFMSRRNANEDIEGGEDRPKRLKSGFSNFGGFLKRSYGEDEADGPTKARRTNSINNSDRTKRSLREEAEDKHSKSKRTKRK